MTSIELKHSRILVINPNSSSSITDDIRERISQLELPHTTISYWTNPKGPPVIQNQIDIDETSAQCIEPLLELAPQYDGLLVACYAQHSLNSLLQLSLAPKPVLGIFEASITSCHDSLVPGARFAILTTGKAWEKSLTAGVNRLYGLLHPPLGADRFAGVIATGITASVYKDNSTGTIKALLIDALGRLAKMGNVNTICLGGVILSKMEESVREACVLESGLARASGIVIIDPVTTGIIALQKLIHNT